MPKSSSAANGGKGSKGGGRGGGKEQEEAKAAKAAKLANAAKMDVAASCHLGGSAGRWRRQGRGGKGGGGKGGSQLPWTSALPPGFKTASDALANPQLSSTATSVTVSSGDMSAPTPPPSSAARPPPTAEQMREADSSARRYSQMTLAELYEEALIGSEGGVLSRSKPPPQTFELIENVRGKRMNTLQGLALHRDVLNPAEQLQTLHYVSRLKDLGDDGALMGRTYSAPRKWMKGKGRVTVQLGCCYNYARDKNGNPPGILPREAVCGMPKFFENIIDRMCERGIFNQQTRPDSCIINFYTEGDCIPPHIDHPLHAPICYAVAALGTEHPLRCLDRHRRRG